MQVFLDIRHFAKNRSKNHFPTSISCCRASVILFGHSKILTKICRNFRHSLFCQTRSQNNIDRELDVYEGVPFAEPPVRFEHPVKKAAWDGTWNATYVRPSCYQQSLYVIKDQLELSEDCLYLNIYVPNGVSVQNGLKKWIFKVIF